MTPSFRAALSREEKGRKARSIADSVSTIVVIVTGLVICFVLIRDQVTEIRHNANDLAENPVRVGSVLPPVNGVKWSDSPETLVIAMQVGCHFCQESAPFYRQLVEEQRAKGDVAVVAVFPDSAEAVKSFCDRYSLRLRAIPDLRLSSLGVRGTPSVILVNRTGTIRKVWQGLLTPEKQADLLRTVALRVPSSA